MFYSKVSSLGYDIANKLKTELRNDIYPQIKNQPRYGKNIKKLNIEDNIVWRYKLGIFRIFYTVKDENNKICILTLDVK